MQGHYINLFLILSDTIVPPSTFYRLRASYYLSRNVRYYFPIYSIRYEELDTSQNHKLASQPSHIRISRIQIVKGETYGTVYVLCISQTDSKHSILCDIVLWTKLEGREIMCLYIGTKTGPMIKKEKVTYSSRYLYYVYTLAT